MNERIQELVSQCIDQRWTVTGPMFDREKFAELIVRECLMKATGAMIRKESIKELIVNIAEDFGVEL